MNCNRCFPLVNIWTLYWPLYYRSALYSELPLVIIIMGYFNLITSQFLKKKRKIFILLSFIIGAVISPTPDMFSQTMIALPMMYYYMKLASLC